MKIHRWDDVEHESMSEGIARRVIHSERMTTARIFVKKGGVVPRHSHDSEQMSHVLEGRLLFEFDDGSREAGPGEVVEIPSNEPHRVVALEDSVAMDVFAPVRGDWLSGDDAYLRNPSGDK
jgi:quercetin dioxygenase-like cupin family protein